MVMKPIFEIHPIQGQILKKLLFSTEVRFSEMNPEKIPTDQFNFHLKSLVDSGLIEKNGMYKLTDKGKEFANRFDTEKMVLERQAKPTVVIGCRRQLKGKKQYLIHKRLKNPYYGYHGYITGKIRWGEEVLETAKREILEETGMTANKLTLVGVEHKRDYAKNGDLLEDKYFFVIRAEDFDTEDFKKYEGGESLWVDKEEISKLPNLFDDMDALMEMFEGNKFSFTEPKYTVKSY